MSIQVQCSIYVIIEYTLMLLVKSAELLSFNVLLSVNWFIIVLLSYQIKQPLFTHA